MEDGMDSGYSVWRMVAATTVSFSVRVSLSASLSRSPNLALALALALYLALLAFSERGDSTEDSISPCFALQPLPFVKHTHTRFLFRSFFPSRVIQIRLSRGSCIRTRLRRLVLLHVNALG